jgi:hypothetical protein
MTEFLPISDVLDAAEREATRELARYSGIRVISRALLDEEIQNDGHRWAHIKRAENRKLAIKREGHKANCKHCEKRRRKAS